MSRIPLILLVLLLVAGCNRAAYVRSDPPVPAAWPEAAKKAAKAEERPPHAVSWRDYFVDAELRKLIAVALENNRDLRLATARVAEARAQYGVSLADKLPTVNLGATSANSRVGGSLASSRATDIRRVDLNLSMLSFELDFWGRVASLNDAARATYLATEEGQRAARLSLISEVANAYFTLLEAGERLDLSRATVASWEQTVEIMASGRAHGAATRLDQLQVESTLASSRVELANLERLHAAALNNLNLLLGAAQGKPAIGKALRLQQTGVRIAAGLPADTLMRRPDIIAAEQRLIAAHANIAVARAAFFPRISLTAGLGLASPALAGLFNTTSQNWNFSPSLSLPIFDSGRVEGNLDVAVARRDLALADYEKTIQQAFREVSDLLAAQAAYTEQRRANEELASAREERVQVIRARFRAGLGNMLDVLDATRAYHDSQQQLLQVQRAQLVSAAQLFKALGGSDS